MAKTPRIVITLPKDDGSVILVYMNVGKMIDSINRMFHDAGFPENRQCTITEKNNKLFVYLPVERSSLRDKYSRATYDECLEDIAYRINQLA